MLWLPEISRTVEVTLQQTIKCTRLTQHQRLDEALMLMVLVITEVTQVQWAPN